MRSFLSWLVGEGKLSGNPTANLRSPRRKRSERRAVAREDVERLISAQPSLRDQIAVMLLAWMGLRKDELRTLRMSDIRLGTQNAVVVHGKGGHEDVLPIGFGRLVEALHLYAVEREASPDEYFMHPRTTRLWPMNQATLHPWLKRALERAGLPADIKMHELRHTAAQELYQLTSDIVLAQQLLRHADIRTTRGYVRGSAERLRSAMAELEESWSA